MKRAWALVRPRTRVQWVAAAVVLYLLVSLGVLLLARHRALGGLHTLEAARDTLTPADLLEGKGEAALREAHGDFSTAHAISHSPLLAPMRLLPVIGRQVRSFDALAGAATKVATIGGDALAEARAKLGGGLPQGPARVAVVRDLESIAADAATAIGRLDFGPSEALVGPLASARADFVEQIQGVREGLERTTVAARGMATLLEGPSTYLLLAGNNAEMRAGSGMFLSAGLLTVQDGRLSLGDMQSTRDLFLATPVPITDPDFAARWGWAGPNQEWRNLGMSPRFDVTAELAARMWEAAGGAPVDGVLGVDVVALQALLAATGPVEVEGQSIDADNVLRVLLHDQYIGIERDDEQTARRERLAAVAKATVARVDGADTDLSTLADQLRTATRGRHLLAWARADHPDEHAAWPAAGVDGTLEEDSLLVSVLNRGQNKLDQFLHVDASMVGSPSAAGTDIVLTVDVTNDVPPGEPAYIAGLDPTAVGGEGVYAGFFSLALPLRALNPRIDGVTTFTAAGADGAASQVLASDLHIAPGERLEVVVRFSLPVGAETLRIEPSARVPAISWHALGEEWTDQEGARRVTW